MTGFWLDVDGKPIHVTGDPYMAEETAQAIAEMVRIVRALSPEQLAELEDRAAARRQPVSFEDARRALEDEKVDQPTK